MVLATSKPKPKLVDANGFRLKNGPSRLAVLPAAYRAAERGKMRAAEKDALNRAKLMSAAKCSIYVSEEIPKGNFFIMDPEALDERERLLCPFKVKTLIVHPDDIERAIRHFGEKKTEGTA